MIIAISGKAGSGKSTFAELLAVPLYRGVAANIQILVRPLATVLGRIVDSLQLERDGVKFRDEVQRLGWAEAKAAHPWMRQAMRKLADCIRESYGPDALTNALLRHYVPSKHVMIVDDLRTVSEYNRLKEKGALFLRVERPGVEVATDDPSHYTETELDGHRFDQWIYNTGSLADLDFIASSVAQRLILPRVVAA